VFILLLANNLKENSLKVLKPLFYEVLIMKGDDKNIILRRSSVSRATKSRVKSKGSIRQLQRIMLGITHRIDESRDESQVRTWRHLRTYMYIVTL
jgi:hypothetical protein